MKYAKAWRTSGTLLASAALASMITVAEPAQEVDARWTAGQTVGGAPPVQFDFLRKSPLLIYNLSGATLLGEVHRQLTLYDDGKVSCSEIDPLNDRAGSVQVKTLSDEAMRQFLDELILYNAHLLADDPHVALDTPLATLTMLFEARDGSVQAHSFSYYPVVAGEEAAAVEGVVQAFLAKHFAVGRDGWSEIDPLQRPQGAQGVDPTRRGRKAEGIEPTRRGRRAQGIDPSQRGRQALEIEPARRGRKAQGIDPTRRGVGAREIDPAKR